MQECHQVDAWGVEYQEEKIRQAIVSSVLKHRIQRGDIQNLHFRDGSFDLVLLNEVLEHIPNQQKALTEINRVLTPDGLLIVFSPNRWYPFETHGVYVRGTEIRIPIYIPFIPYIPTCLGKYFFHYWARNYWQSELVSLVEGHGFRVTCRSYVWQTFENISGTQPYLIRRYKRFLRFVANCMESIPFVKRFAISQVIVARKI
jgi:ubiquinone/menaquinone biosynthesis C-methylase UbiE